MNQRFKKTILQAGLSLTIATGLSLGSVALAQVAWDMPTGYGGSNFHTENIRQFAKDVDTATNGKFKITVHDGGSLFKSPEIKRAVQGGQAQIGEIIISGYSNENALFGVDTIPFLATSYKEAQKLKVASEGAINAEFAKQGLKILTQIPWPPQGIFSAKPINSAADLKGVKWRAYSPATSRIAQLVGAQPVTIQAAELSQALATGAVEAFITSSSTGYDSKVWEQVKYFYDVQAWLPKNFIFVNQKSYDALDENSKTALLKAAKDAEERGWKVSEEKTQWWVEQLSKNGMNVSPPSAQLKADMTKVGETLVSEWLAQTGAAGKTIMDNYKK